MKKIIITAIACAGIAFVIPVEAHAGTELCNGHMNNKDASFGYASAGDDPRFISMCDGDNGPDYQNNAQIPAASPHPDARQPMESASNTDSTYGSADTQSQQDEDGIQGHDNVRNSPMFVPGG